MKKNLFKRILLLVVAMFMFLASGATFAAEVDTHETNSQKRVSSTVNGIVSPNGSTEVELELGNYIGLNKKFIVNAVSNSTSGALLLYLYKPNGQLASQDWIMGINEVAQWSLFLPSAGQWRLKLVASGTNDVVEFFARWE